MYQRLGDFVTRHWLAIIVAWAALVPTVRWIAPSWDAVTNDGDLAYLPARMTTVRAERLMERAFPHNRAKSQFVVVFEREGGLTAQDRALVEQVGAWFSDSEEHELPIVSVVTPKSEVVGRRLISPDGKAALVMVNLNREFMTFANIAGLGRIEGKLEALRDSADFPAGLAVGISGSAAIGGDMLAAAEDSIRNIEIATVVLVVLILLLVYRAPLLTIIPLASIMISVVVAMGLVAMLSQLGTLPGFEWCNYKIFKTTKIFVVVVLFGSGTDYCLFLIARYREELERGLDHVRAVAAAVTHTGEAVVASALTAIVGLGMMFFADFGKFSNSGPTIALSLLVTLAACMTLAPAILRATGQLIFWPFKVQVLFDGKGAVEGDRLAGGFWDRLSRAILARPAAILLASVVLLAPLAYVGYRDVTISYDLVRELPKDRASVIGTSMVRRHFPAGETGPIAVLVHQQDGAFDTPEGERNIAHLTRLLYDIDGVESVRSITEPLGDKPGTGSTPITAAGRRKLAARKHPRSQALYLTQVPELAGQVARLDVVTRYEPFSREAANLVEIIDERLLKLSHDEGSTWHGAEFDFSGPTAGTRDLRAVTNSDQRLIQQLVCLAVYVVLIAIVRRPLISIYLVLSVLFSYYVTMGATELLFRWAYPDFDGLDWKVPLFLFVILVAIGEDYNIYLITRVIEEQRERGLLAGLRAAVVRTGGIITSCGVIMAGSFISMITGTLRGIVELGFALSLGVLLDTVVVRPILVPAFLALWWRRDRGHVVQAALEQPRAVRPSTNGNAPLRPVEAEPVRSGDSRDR
ncbi:MAG TPA: MMPL family transporter [Pirellulales bacterium]|nr:MMPL family transporter [Pirellulales bacterium]